MCVCRTAEGGGVEEGRAAGAHKRLSSGNQSMESELGSFQAGGSRKRSGDALDRGTGGEQGDSFASDGEEGGDMHVQGLHEIRQDDGGSGLGGSGRGAAAAFDRGGGGNGRLSSKGGGRGDRHRAEREGAENSRGAPTRKKGVARLGAVRGSSLRGGPERSNSSSSSLLPNLGRLAASSSKNEKDVEDA